MPIGGSSEALGRDVEASTSAGGRSVPGASRTPLAGRPVVKSLRTLAYVCLAICFAARVVILEGEHHNLHAQDVRTHLPQAPDPPAPLNQTDPPRHPEHNRGADVRLDDIVAKAAARIVDREGQRERGGRGRAGEGERGRSGRSGGRGTARPARPSPASRDHPSQEGEEGGGGAVGGAPAEAAAGARARAEAPARTANSTVKILAPPLEKEPPKYFPSPALALFLDSAKQEKVELDGPAPVTFEAALEETLEIIGKAPPKVRVLVVVPDLAGCSQAEDIRRSYAALAVHLSAQGTYNVSLALLDREGKGRARQAWAQRLANPGHPHPRIIPRSSAPAHAQGPVLGLGPAAAASWSIMEWLQSLPREEVFGVVHFVDYGALGYHSLQLRQAGLGLQASKVVLGLFSPTGWLDQMELWTGQRSAMLDQLEVEQMEMECASLADLVISPSDYMLYWARRNGFRLPSVAIVLPPIVHKNSLLQDSEQVATNPATAPIRRVLVLLPGVQDRRTEASTTLVCDALDLVYMVRQLGSRHLAVEFLFEEEAGAEDARGYSEGKDRLVQQLHARARTWQRWSSEVHFADGATQEFHRELQDSLRRNKNKKRPLQAGTHVVVAPMLYTNVPYSVLEVLGAGMPLLVSGVGGIASLLYDYVPRAGEDKKERSDAGRIAKNDKERQYLERFYRKIDTSAAAGPIEQDLASGVFKMFPSSLAHEVKLALANGLQMSRMSPPPHEAARMWRRIHETLAFLADAVQQKEDAKGLPIQGQAHEGGPLVAAVMVFGDPGGNSTAGGAVTNRISYQVAIDAMKRQTHRNLVVELVHDGSPLDSQTDEWLRHLSQSFKKDGRNWQVRLGRNAMRDMSAAALRSFDAAPGRAARNLGAELAPLDAKWLMFMGPNTVPKPSEVEWLVAGAEAMNADILVPFAECYEMLIVPPQEDPLHRPDIGWVAGASALVHKLLTGGHMLVRRDVFTRLGGFTNFEALNDMGPGRAGAPDEDAEFELLLAATLQGMRVVEYPRSTYWVREAPDVLATRQAHRATPLSVQTVSSFTRQATKAGVRPSFLHVLERLMCPAGEEASCLEQATPSSSALSSSSVLSVDLDTLQSAAGGALFQLKPLQLPQFNAEKYLQATSDLARTKQELLQASRAQDAFVVPTKAAEGGTGPEVPDLQPSGSLPQAAQAAAPQEANPAGGQVAAAAAGATGAGESHSRGRGGRGSRGGSRRSPASRPAAGAAAAGALPAEGTPAAAADSSR